MAFGLNTKNQNDQLEAVVTTLNKFYQAAMTKMWNHLDSREIAQLKGEADQLKTLKRY